MKEPEHVIEAAIGLFSGPTAKWLIGLATAAASYVLPTPVLQEMAIGLTVFVVFDTVTGIMAARADGKPVSSAKFSRFITKLVGYSVSVITVTVAIRVVPGFAEYAPGGSALVMGLALATEGISILENLDRMGIRLPDFVRKAFEAKETQK